jgi:hypothetical protein
MNSLAAFWANSTPVRRKLGAPALESPRQKYQHCLGGVLDPSGSRTLATQGILRDPAANRGGPWGLTVGGNDPGFRRLAPPKTSENSIAFAIAFSEVVPAHGIGQSSGEVAVARRGQ